jgi:hypothetical protein
MPVTKKPYDCVICGEIEPKMFSAGRKSCCKVCVNKYSQRERRKLILLPYECEVCGTKDEANFYKYCKNKCRKHYNLYYKMQYYAPIIKIVKAPKNGEQDSE